MHRVIAWKETLALFLVIALFCVSAYFAQAYADSIHVLFKHFSTQARVLYVLLAAVATVLAPLSTAPLIPIASMMWGPTQTALLSILGWSVGAFVAFTVSRRYGYVFLKRFERTRRLQKYLGALTKRELFLIVIVLRVSMPVDVLSYILGLFTQMSVGRYMVATVIGISPFAFVFAHVAMLPLSMQITALLLVITTLFIVHHIVAKRIRNAETD